MKKTLACTLALTVALAVIPMSTALFASAETITVEGTNDIANYTLYSSNTETTVTSEEGWPLVSPATAGAKKAVLKDLEVADFTASYTTVLDENGRTKTGLIFRGSKFGGGQDAQSGFICVLERNTRDSNKPVTLVLQKYGKSADGTADKWLGVVPLTNTVAPETDPLDGETAADTVLIFNAQVSGNTFKASVKMEDGTQLYAVEADLTAKAEKEETLGVDYNYTTGAVGFYMTNDGGLRPYNKIKNISIKYEKSSSTGSDVSTAAMPVPEAMPAREVMPAPAAMSAPVPTTI